MINGLYSATTGMFIQQSRLDVIASNIANANVPGFKGERVTYRSFPDALRIESRVPSEKPGLIGPLGGGATLDEITTNYASGQIVHTGQDTDLAIFGEGFFHLDTPEGERLTRNGSFYRDSEGYIRNSDGNLLLGENGHIQIVERSFRVSGNGEIFVERDSPTADGRLMTQTVRVDQIKLSRVPNLQDLERQGNSKYFLPIGEEEAVEPFRTRVGQGYLEMANVNAIEETIRMIDTFRAYQSAQRLILAMDGILDKAVNEVGRV